MAPLEKKLSDALDACQKEVHESLLDNINTSSVISSLLAMVKEFNTYLASVEKDANHALRPFLVESLAKYVTYILNCMGISGEANAPLGFTDIEAGSEGDRGNGTATTSAATSNDTKEEILAPTLDGSRPFATKSEGSPKEKSSLQAPSWVSVTNSATSSFQRLASNSTTNPMAMLYGNCMPRASWKKNDNARRKKKSANY